jgi:transcriptional regulator with XRE-family HTH domain
MIKIDGGWLQGWRLQNNYRQSELADELMVSRQTIINWERSESLDRVVHLAVLALAMEPSLQNIGARKRRRRSR